MNPPFSTCEGSKCPSQKNCRRHVERNIHESVPAALWIRRDPGASACDMYMPINVMSTFASADTEGGE